MQVKPRVKKVTSPPIQLHGLVEKCSEVNNCELIFKQYRTVLLSTESGQKKYAADYKDVVLEKRF